MTLLPFRVPLFHLCVTLLYPQVSLSCLLVIPIQVPFCCLRVTFSGIHFPSIHSSIELIYEPHNHIQLTMLLGLPPHLYISSITATQSVFDHSKEKFDTKHEKLVNIKL